MLKKFGCVFALDGDAVFFLFGQFYCFMVQLLVKLNIFHNDDYFVMPEISMAKRRVRFLFDIVGF